jgi:hypothetical protein
MSPSATLREQPEVRLVGGRLAVAVHWRDADDLHGYLQRAGIPSVRSWDPAARRACLQLAADADAARVRAVLDDWLN